MPNIKWRISICVLLIANLLFMTYWVVLKRDESGLDKRSERDYFVNFEKFNGLMLPFPKSVKHDSMPLGEAYKALITIYDAEQDKFDQAIPHLATSKYFSIEARFYAGPPRGYSIYTSVTIDLEQRKEVFLNDLINTNDDFMYLLKSGGIAKTDENLSLLEEFGFLTDFSSLPLEEIREIVDSCSIPITNDNWLRKHIFFLAPGRLYFCYSDNSMVPRKGYLYVNVDDIEEFLKVEKW